MAGFDVWLEKLSKNAPKTVFFKMFFINKLVGHRSFFNCDILLYFFRCEFCKTLSRY